MENLKERTSFYFQELDKKRFPALSTMILIKYKGHKWPWTYDLIKTVQ